MCLILFSWQPETFTPLVVVANRDEFYQRETARLAHWQNSPVIAGKDLQAGGTWMGITREGRFAAVTNYRQAADMKQAFSLSRGLLCQRFLEGNMSIEAYLDTLAADAMKAGGFNLLLGTGTQMAWATNRYPHEKGHHRFYYQADLPSGIYGLSNHLLDSPWPKVCRGKKHLAMLLSQPQLQRQSVQKKQSVQEHLSETTLLQTVRDSALPDDNQLPDTGIGIEKERFLAPAFIASSDQYGTRASTLLIRDKQGNQTMTEQSWGAFGQQGSCTRIYLPGHTQNPQIT